MVYGQQRLAQPGVTVRIITHVNNYWADLCSSCKQFPNEPIQTLKGHRYCKDCLISHGKERKLCPDCVNENVPPEDDCTMMGACYLDKGSKLDVDRLTAVCLQCNHETSMKNMEVHLRTCQGAVNRDVQETF